ncbi:hypothetical protein ACNJ7E_14780 [Rhodococcus sp. NM-2]|uniref:hypothetical protein n=1 Tax=Rhodococcus sp. NM-2 TaxID=3401174 RepID=UPI003AACD616
MTAAKPSRAADCNAVDVDDAYRRFDIERPEHLPEDHWACIAREADRLGRSLDAGDVSQALSDIKCLVESISRVVLDIDGTPADPRADFDTLVNRAHTLLAGQPGHQLANTSLFGDLATQASKIARNLAKIRNAYGGGHGRSRTPEVNAEMLILALDGGLLWARWALRRIGYFAIGRPTVLIDDLVVQSKVFRAGDLQKRLLAANLSSLEPHHQRSIGVAVGQRVMRGTFVVRGDGLDPCLASDDLNTWPRDYRIGLAYGLWFDPDNRLTLTSQSLKDALQVLEPVPDCMTEIEEWVARIKSEPVPSSLAAPWSVSHAAAEDIRSRIPRRSAEEGAALAALADHLNPDPF